MRQRCVSLLPSLFGAAVDANSAQPGAFLSHLIGHEGDGSILSYLKRKGWANSLSSGCGSGATGFAFFKVHVDLTQAGLDHYEEVAGAVFKYIELLKQCPPEEWAFLEVRRLNDIAFRFKEKSPPTMVSMSLSLEMSKPLPRENLLSAPYITKTFNKSLIETCINGLSPERCRVMVATQKGLPGITYDQKEKWYGTEYSIQPMSAKMMNRQEASIPELFLPKPNEFIPTDLAVHDKKPVEHPAKRPISLRNTPTMRLWYKKDDRWWVPRASVFFLLKSPLVDDSAKNAVHARFFTELIQDALMEYSYDAELAGLSYQYDVQGDGILLTVEGYNDKLNVLSKVILEKMANLQVDPPRFERVKDQLQRLWTNYRLEQPYQHALFSMSVLTIEVMYTPEQKLETLPDVSPESLQAYIKALTERAHFELMVHGNILKNVRISPPLLLHHADTRAYTGGHGICRLGGADLQAQGAHFRRDALASRTRGSRGSARLARDCLEPGQCQLGRRAAHVHWRHHERRLTGQDVPPQRHAYGSYL